MYSGAFGNFSGQSNYNHMHNYNHYAHTRSNGWGGPNETHKEQYYGSTPVGYSYY